jgi:hypothetical protein
MDAWGYVPLDPWDEGALDAWPDHGVGIWPTRPTDEPLLPPVPTAAPDRVPLGWVLEWPVAWLGDAAFESWGHWGQRERPRPRRRAQRPLPPRVARYADSLGFAPARRRGGGLVLLASLLLIGLAGLLTVGRSFPALGQPLGALREGAGNLGNEIGNGVSGGIGGAPEGDATPSAAPLAPPALGSDAQDFAAFYGAHFLAGSATAHFQPQVHGVSIALDVSFGTGADHRDHVTSLTAGASSLAGWDAATADAICATFLPPDAQLAGVTHLAANVEYRYTSASLAAAFTSAYFVDDAYNPVAPGTLNRLDAPPLGSATGVGSCTLSLGAH